MVKNRLITCLTPNFKMWKSTCELKGVPKSFVIGIDVGGTKIRFALFDRSFRVIDEIKAKTAANNPKDFAAQVRESTEKLLRSRSVSTIGVGCAGSANIPALQRFSFQ